MLTTLNYYRDTLRKMAKGLSLAAMILAASQLHAGIRVDSLMHEYQMNPGQEQRGTFVITNTSSEPLEIELNHHDYIPVVGGRTEQPQIGTHPRSNGRWITLKPHQNIIPANAKGKVDYVISAPKSAKDGAYWSAFTILPKAIESTTGAKVGLVQRTGYVVQVISRIGSNRQADINITELYGQKNGQNKDQYIMNLKNVSDVDAALASYIEVYSSKGDLITRAMGTRRRLYPGTEVTFTFNLDQEIEKGDYSSLIVLDDGGENYFGVQKQLRVSSNGEHTFK